MTKSFAEISRLYGRARGISVRQGNALTAICAVETEELGAFGKAAADKIRNRHIAEVAQRLYPSATNATRNRMVVVPVTAALRWAAKEELIAGAPMVERFREDKVPSRRPAAGALERLIGAAEGERKAFLILLRCQGWRLSEALWLKWDNVDFEAGTLTVWIGKARTTKVVAAHPDTLAALKALDMTGKRVFSWKSPQSVYGWLKPLCESLDIRFTPHMARHEFASRMNELGASMIDLTRLGTWESTGSLSRYINPSDDHTRGLLAKL